MSKSKNSKLLVPLNITNVKELRLAKLQESKTFRDSQKKKELLIKAYEHDSPLLRGTRLRKAQPDNQVAVSYQQQPMVVHPQNYRYASKNMDLSEYLQEGRLQDEQLRPYIRRSSRGRPGSLFKIAEKSSVAEIRTTRQHARQRSDQRIDMSENHSVDLFKVKQQRRLSVAPSSLNSRMKELMESGRKLYRQGKLEMAEKIFVDAIEEDSRELQPYYFLGIIALNRKQFDTSKEHFQNILKSRPDYKKSVYFFACITLKNMNNLDEAIELASKGLQIFPNYVDLIMYRAKLHTLKNSLKLADQDYDRALKIKDDNAQAYFKKGQCLSQLKEWKKAVASLNTAVYLDQGYKNRAMHQRVRCYLALDNISQAHKDIDRLVQVDNHSSETFELRGLVQVKEGLLAQAILSFEQCIKINSNKNSLCTALIEICKAKILDRDFYSAYHHIGRSQFLQLASDNVDMYRLFTQGVVFLMKRKITEGLQNLNTLVKRYPQMDEFMIKLFYLYRAYGYFVSSQHDLSLADYIQAEKYEKKDRHAIFNMYLTQGIIEAKTERWEGANDYYNKAQMLLPGKLQPYLYRAVTGVLMACKEHKDDEIKKLEVVFQSLKQLDKAYDLNSCNSNQLFLRGLIYYYLGKLNEGLEDIGRAISKSEENVPKYFFYRGLGHGTLKNYKQCQNDMTICINLDENFSEAYLERSKAMFLQGQTQKSFQDITKYCQKTPQADRYFIEGCLLFSNNDYEEAVRKFEKSKENRQCMTMKIRCYIIMGEYDKAIAQLTQLELQFQEQGYSVDLAIVSFLQLYSKHTDNVETFGEKHQQALNNIIKTLQANKTSRNSSSALCLFGQLHVYHYLGIVYLLTKQYQNALVEFSKAHKERQLLNIENQFDFKDIKNILSSQESQFHEDTSPEKEFNQINYNIFLCYILLKEYKKAYELFVRDVVPAKENVFQHELLTVYSRMVFQMMRREKELEGAQPPDKLDMKVLLFDNVLSRSTPQLVLELKGNTVRTNVCLLLPNLKAYRMLPQISSKEIILKINLSEVENKPQPPWVRRTDEQNLIFTNEIQQVDNVQFNTEENQEESQEQEEESDDEGSYQEEQEEPQEKMDVESIRQAMKLDDSIEKKLNKILNKSKQEEK